MWLYGTAILVFLLDQITKLIAVNNLPLHSSTAVIHNVFHLTLVQNTGIAFGIFNEHGQVLSWLISLCMVVLLIVSRSFYRTPAIQQAAFGIIFGGALGNWLDRMRLGFVVDFLDFRVWPVFNVADSCITAGIFLFLWINLKQQSKHHVS